jgi:hypothetical protein
MKKPLLPVLAAGAFSLSEALGVAPAGMLCSAHNAKVL